MIKIFIIDDHSVTIRGLRTLFRPSRDEIVIAVTANNIEDALLIQDSGSFHIIFLDLGLPSGTGPENYKRISEKFPGKPIVIYTGEVSLQWQRKMYRLGAKAFINKQADKQLIESTVESVMNGETVYTPMMLGYQTKRKIDGYTDSRYGLTPVQADIIRHLMDGLDTKQIADKIAKGQSAVWKNLVKIREIFEVENNIELVQRLLNLDEWNPPDSTKDASPNL
jgi:NarL family two-component system response regulator YdfI